MDKILINDSLKICFPDSFHVMSKEERAEVNNKTGDRGICLKAPDLHIIISIAWVRVDGIRGVFSRLFRGKDPVKNAESFYKKKMKAYGYKTEQYLKYQIGGTDAEGLRYSYLAQGIDMMGETCSLKKDRVLYYFHCYYRAQQLTESQDVWKTILDSAQWE